jgi:Fic family protein
MKCYEPPYDRTPAILRLVAEISECIGHYTAFARQSLTPQLRRANRIRTIQASLEIEQNTLSLEQVTAVLDGKSVLGHPKEVQEVRNAFATYETLDTLKPTSLEDLLKAHQCLMAGLIDQAGQYRSGSVGVAQGKDIVHVAPPAERVPDLLKDLLQWLHTTDEHPLVASCVFHYEFEFIHPFTDGNGRMGRLWQTLILKEWKPLFAHLPVETIIRDRQTAYYKKLAESDKTGKATAFVEFMLEAIKESIQQAISTDQVSDRVSDRVKRLLLAIGPGEKSSAGLMKQLKLSHAPSFRKNYLSPALEAKWIERTQPDSPKSPTQAYRLTPKGRHWLAARK